MAKYNNELLKVVDIRGCINVEKNPMELDKFIEEFKKLIESNGWKFDGDVKASFRPSDWEVK